MKVRSIKSLFLKSTQINFYLEEHEVVSEDRTISNNMNEEEKDDGEDSQNYDTIEEFFLDAVRFGDATEVGYCLGQKVDFACVDDNVNNCLRN